MKPVLRLDLSGPSGNIFFLTGYAAQLLTGMMREHFVAEIKAAQMSGYKYLDMLAIVNRYVTLVDTSGMYPQYAEIPIDHEKVMAAAMRLRDEITTLPGHISTLVDEILPDFDEPDIGPSVYLTLVEEEIERIEGELMAPDVADRASLQKLREMLVACSIALHKAGVRT